MDWWKRHSINEWIYSYTEALFIFIYITNQNLYIATQEFNKLTADNFGARLEEAKLAAWNDIADFVKKTDFYEKIKKIKNRTR